MSKRKQEKPQTRQRVDENSKLWLFGGLIRNADYLARAAEVFKVEYFNDYEKWLRLVWDVSLNSLHSRGRLPSKNLLITQCNSEIERNPKLLSDIDIAQLSEFIGTTFSMDLEDWPDAEVMKVLRKFIEDRISMQHGAKLTLPTMPSDMGSVLSSMLLDVHSLSALTKPPTELPFEEDWYMTDRSGERISTGIKFLDEMLDGGQVRTETYGVLGPTGGGKTTLMLMIAGEAARRGYQEWQQSGFEGPPPRYYHCSYEAGKEEVRLRVLSYLARIPRKHLEKMVQSRDLSTLSGPDNLHHYEKLRFAKMIAAGLKPPCERTRYRRAIKILNSCFRIMDYTGASADGDQVRGQGLVEEIAADIRRDVQANRGMQVLGVGVDYVLAAAEMHVEWSGKDHSEMRHIINRWPWNIRMRAGLPFNCPVWSAQQLNTEANTLRPGSLPKASESSEGKAFAFNCDFCFVCGLATPDGRLPFDHGKHRRTAATKPRILQLQGQDCELIDVSHEWTLNERSKTIEPLRETEQLAQATSVIESDATEGHLTPEQKRLLKQQQAAHAKDASRAV